VSLHIHNTLSRRKELFEPLDPGNVRFYVCGPTVYDFAHIGNARPVVVFDLLFRLLNHIYGPDHVTYARNITDIDDKIIKSADDEGVDIDVISKRYTDIFHQNISELGVLEPSIEPRATDHLPAMITMMKVLIASGHAYAAEGHVLFEVAAMESYGKLSRRNREELIDGARVEVAPYKKDPADFVMWKPSSDDQPGWDSPWGRGRPGWHLECSCMAEEHLGTTIDIHGGGQDLIFPHHENEIAQSECAHGQTFVRYWMHNGYLNMSGEKMSKSLGNIETIDELLKKHRGEALRLTLLAAQYRKPLDFSDELVRNQKRRLDRWYRITDGVEVGDVPSALIEALEDDLNTPKALAVLEDLATPQGAAQLIAGGQFMGLLQASADEWFRGDTSAEALSEEEVVKKLAEREEARESKDFARADQIRHELEEAGIALEDGPDGTTWRRLD
jgi:cysteinyl-tRNA synthetase